MYGQFEILRIVDELRREEQMAAVRLHYLTKRQLDCQSNTDTFGAPFLKWVGRGLVVLGYRLLGEPQPRPVNQCI